MKHGMVDYGPRRRRVLPVLATILMILGLLATPAGLLSHWASNQVLDNRNFADSLAPLATAPAVQDFVTSRATDAITRNLDVEALSTAVADSLPGWVPEAMANQLRESGDALAGRIKSSAATAVTDTVHSPAFATQWERAIRASHERTVRMLRATNGADPALAGTVDLDLGPLLERVKDEMGLENMSLSTLLPQLDREVTVLEYSLPPSSGIWVGIIDATEGWLMWLGIALLGLAALLDPPRLPRVLGLLAVVLALSGALIGAAGRRLGGWAGHHDLDPQLLHLAFSSLAEPLHRQLIAGAVGVAVLAVLLTLFRLAPGVRGRIVRALLLALVLAAGLGLLLYVSLPTGGLLLIGLLAAVGVVVVLEMRNARPHRKTGAARR